MRFSQRISKKPVKTEIQIEGMDADLRTGLWNVVYKFVMVPAEAEFSRIRGIRFGSFEQFFTRLWQDYLKRSLDELAEDSLFLLYPGFSGLRQKIGEWFFKWEWNEVYDFIEFVAQTPSPVYQKAFRRECNLVLEKELSGYRLVDTQIVAITDEIELQEIEEAIQNTRGSRLAGVRGHLKNASSKLSDRKEPDYRNSIKESISAVEAMAQIISGKPKASFGDALKAIEGQVKIHSALKKGFLAIYGYTSDEDGIRHAMLEEPDIGFEDAKYMLVSCATFINYLKAKVAKAGIKL